MAMFTSGDRGGCLALLQRLIAAGGGDSRLHRLAAFVLHDGREYDRALYHAEKAVALNPKGSQARTMLGIVLDSMGRGDEALAAMREAVQLNPRDAEGWTTLGSALDGRDRFDESIEAHRRALSINPGHTAAVMNLSLALLATGRAREAVDLVRAHASRHPGDERLAQRLAFCLNYDDRATRGEINAAHRAWGALVEKRVRPMTPRAEEKDVLRIGLMSPDFRRHSVSHFVRPVLERLDRGRFEVHALFTSTRADEVTDSLRPLADAWHDVGTLTETELAEHVRGAGIDILVDLCGHFAGGRLGVPARKPAPVQITWLGYPGTTGLSRVDARLVDSLTDPAWADELPENERESERLVRLDPCFLCYTPPADAPEPGDRARRDGEPITFVSFNDAKKISPATLDMFAGVLARVEGSRLVLKCGALSVESVARRFAAEFVTRGVDPARVVFEGHTPSQADHLAAYRGADLALDTFPYGGTTTTCEALWMGVPVISRAGQTHASRVGLSLLTNIGLPELAADSEQGFVDLAASIALDPGRLAVLRSGLRGRVARSPLVDADGFAGRFADVCAALWDRAGNGPG